jgi:hypothetical protein
MQSILTLFNSNFTQKTEKRDLIFTICVTEAANSKQMQQFNLPENLGCSFLTLHPANCELLPVL